MKNADQLKNKLEIVGGIAVHKITNTPYNVGKTADLMLWEIFEQNSPSGVEKAHLKVLQGVLGGTYGGPSLGIQDGDWVLYAWTDAPVGEEILCRHPDWNQFIRLVAEYSDYVEGDL